MGSVYKRLAETGLPADLRLHLNNGLVTLIAREKGLRLLVTLESQRSGCWQYKAYM
jgi:hypothetical protein